MIELMNSLTTEKQNPKKPKLASRNVRNIRRSFSNSGSADSFNEIDSDSDISFDDDVISPADNNQPKRKLKSFSDTPDWLELVDSLVNTLPKVI